MGSFHFRNVTLSHSHILYLCDLLKPKPLIHLFDSLLKGKDFSILIERENSFLSLALLENLKYSLSLSLQ